MRKVAILCPAHDGKVHCNFSISIAEVFRIGAHLKGMSMHLTYLMHESLLESARNNLLLDAYEAGMDDFVFIDADQSFDPAAFFSVLNYPVDVVGVPVRMKSEKERYNIRPENKEKYTYDPWLGLLEVPSIGTGFIRLTRKAVEHLISVSTPYQEDGRTKYRMFEVVVFDNGLASEDVQMCNKLIQGGFKIYVDINYTCTHYGTQRYDGDFKNYYFSA